MASTSSVFLRPLPANGQNYRQRYAYGPTTAGGFETALSIEINSSQLAPYADVLACVDGLIRCVPFLLTGNLVLQPSPKVQQDVAKTLGIRGPIVFVYRHLNLSTITAATARIIQALGPKAFPSTQQPPALGAAFGRGEFWLSVKAGEILGQASTEHPVAGWAEMGFEIVFVPGGIGGASSGPPSATLDPAWERLQQLVTPSALTRRLDPMAFYTAVARGTGPLTLDPSHANHTLIFLATRRVLIEVRDEYDAPYTEPVTITKGAAAPTTAAASANSRGTFVVDVQPVIGPAANLQYTVTAPNVLFTELPTGDGASNTPTRTMEPASHWALQAVFASLAPSAADEPRSWFVANAGGLPRYTTRNRVTPYRDGVALFAEYARAIRTCTGASQYIYAAGWAVRDGFQFEPGVPGSTFAELTTTIATAGASVRALIWDDVTGMGSGNSDAVDHINALTGSRGRAILDDETEGLFGAHHQKQLVVNGGGGAIAFCGGMDINDDRMDSDRHGALGAYHDVHAKVEGPAVADLTTNFVQRWNAHPLTVAAPATALSTAAPPFAAAPGTCLVQVARTFSPRFTRAGNYPFVSPGGALTSLSVLRRAVQRAKRFIYIEDQFLTPYAGDLTFAAADDTTGLVGDLRSALARIDYLVIVIPNHCAAPPQIRYRRSGFISALLSVASAKVDVFFLERAGTGTSPGFAETATTGGGGADSSGGQNYRREVYVHSKVWIVDDVIAKIGSSNINRRSLTSDTELDLVTLDEAVDNGTRRFARNLRMDLWAEHLGLGSSGRATLEDIDTAVALLRAPPKGARLRRYLHGTELEALHTRASWDGADPDAQ